jgi:hypothetical protein
MVLLGSLFEFEIYEGWDGGLGFKDGDFLEVVVG